MKKLKNQISGNTAFPGLFMVSAVVILFLCVFNSAKGQNNLNITFRPGANYPLKDLGTTKLNNGTCGFETTIAYRFMPHLQAYGGWGSNWFSENESNADLKLQFLETGYSFGLQFIHPMSSESKLNFMIGGGGIYNHIETENKNGDLLYDTGHELGWQADVGLLIPLGHHNRWQIMPTFRYRTLSGDITSDRIKTPFDLNYISVGVGVIWTVWRTE
jgi:hypothetical protein